MWMIQLMPYIWSVVMFYRLIKNKSSVSNLEVFGLSAFHFIALSFNTYSHYVYGIMTVWAGMLIMTLVWILLTEYHYGIYKDTSNGIP